MGKLRASLKFDIASRSDSKVANSKSNSNFNLLALPRHVLMQKYKYSITY